MLNTAQTSIRDVLNNRRKQLHIRLGLGLFLTVTYGILLGWRWALFFAALYISLQGLEVFCFSGRKPWLAGNGKRERSIALGMLAMSSAVFGAPAWLLIQRLGPWGEVWAAYLFCGTIVVAVLTTIGCRAAFHALTIPYFVYLCILPFSTLGLPDPPNPTIPISLIGGSIFLMLNVRLLWTSWSRSKLAEIHAVRRYVAARDDNERRLFQMTQQDALTGLLNRNVLQARLAENAADGGTGVLLMIDLDGFKYVNDTLGHSAGDRVLREIARRIRIVAGTEYTAARLGGDEFALLLPGVGETAAAMAVADRLIAEMSQPVGLDGRQVNIGASIGIVIHPLHGENAEQLYANADLALYQAKAEGRHCARLYHPGLRATAQGKVLRDTELRLALERGEFEMFYQPQVRLADGRLTGAEALLRWRHPEQGLLKPSAFLGALEGGLLSALVGDWVIETACRQAAAWRAAGVPDFRMGVNLFGAQFRCGNLVGWVTTACAKAGLPPEALEIEITENVILRHEDDIIGPLQELRALDIGVAFDDYGTGFASLSMLTRYPVSRLKIDRSFIKAICDSPPEAAIIHAVIGLARKLHLKVTAEGIETPEQAAALVREGCDEGQGYYFGTPMSAVEFSSRFGIGTRAEPVGLSTLI